MIQSSLLRYSAAGLLTLTATFPQEPPEHGHGTERPTQHATPALKRSEPVSIPTRAPEPTDPARPIRIARPTTTKDVPELRRADEALAMLKDGNDRWVAGAATNPNIGTQRRQDTAENGQQPLVTVLTCADSRIPVERVFDRGVGDVFVVRVAGNIVGAAEAGTIEYGVEHLKTPLLVVMGHTKCGAVAAAVSGAELHGKVAALVSTIKPAVDRATRNNPRAMGDDLARLAVRENVWQSVFDLLKNSDECRERVSSGKLRVIGAIYDISSGKVEWLGEHPWQTELVNALETREATAPEPKDAH